MPSQDIYSDADNLVYSLDKVLVQIIVAIFKENLTKKKRGQYNDLFTAIEEIKKIKLKDLNLNDVLMALDSLDKCHFEESNEFTIKCYNEIIKLDDPKHTLNALYFFFDKKLDDLFKSNSLSKENFINIIFQHKFPEKIVNIIYILNKHKLFSEERLEIILRLSPQDLNYFEKNLTKTHNYILRKKNENIIFYCLGDSSYGSLSTEGRRILYKKKYVKTFVDKFFEEGNRER